MANTYLKKTLTTNRTTPAIGDHLIARIGALLPRLAELGYEHQEMARCANILVERMESYRHHRAEDDPDRTPTHKALCEIVKGTVEHVVAIHNMARDRAWVPWGLPVTEEHLEAIFSAWETATCITVCKGCTKPARMPAENFGYCLTCEPMFVQKCKTCGKKARVAVQALSNDYRVTLFYCKDHIPDDLKVCGACGCRATGKTAKGHGISADNLAKEGKFLCFNCEGAYQKAGCGHTALNVVVTPDVPNVEDDNSNPDGKRYNNTSLCVECAATHNQAVEHWKSTKQLAPNAPAKSGKPSFEEVGSSRTYGVELEVCAVNQMKRLPDDLKAYWTTKRDGSLPNGGVEFASAVLWGDRGLEIIEELCDYAHKHKWSVDAKSGYHLHVGMDGLKVHNLAAIAIGYLFTRKLWASFVVGSRSESRYCKSHSNVKAYGFFKEHPQKIIDSLTNNEERYRWINWQAYKTHRTLEVRLHQGTLNYTKITNWIKAHTRFMEWCAGVGTTPPKGAAWTGPIGRVYQEMRDRCGNGKDMLDFLGKEVWKDEAMAEWFKERAIHLKHGKDVIAGGSTTDIADASKLPINIKV